MHLAHPSADACANFVHGFDAAWGGGLLFGFREWLIVKVDSGSNFGWSGLVVLLARKSGHPKFDPTEEKPENVAFLLDTLETFLAERKTMDGPRTIFLRFDDWLRKQEWYDSESPGWVPRQSDLAKTPQSTKASRGRSNKPSRQAP
ncbi:hypothetical protein FJV41_01435 [Myxococcus llanfairpwllgwyngyllgogerychwyrndrobwllllantysiliogogogochensis]|uniref:Uncharacterized protein n=1 Tax=Myxococcus llanfairpwllgwyngyllgogerychwyrndrobwllllantysiliogogogochensis TaxID=2590453 RepID=A0A540X9D1_9BACT|nr:hypothetical protein [Myxococcus llanfairpwllgwyngyllgogerychwyrndrobwllllantysiliogogogochensis]TQF17832.1 hypothetical protein FJV41_01435 [Myxococcus llanfairpwllgwyngyllgogerychwyrndrobwllllantysiliogogogochensis]